MPHAASTPSLTAQLQRTAAYCAVRCVDALRERLGQQPWLLSTRVALKKRAIWANTELPDAGATRRMARLGGFPASWIVIAIAVVVGWLLGEWAFPPTQISPGADTAILGRCLEILIAVVGIIVPLLILVIEFYGREARVTDLIIQRSGALRHVLLSLSGLVLAVLAFARTAGYQGHYAGYFPSRTVCAVMAGTLGIVVETGLFARRAVLSLGEEGIYTALGQRLRLELQRSVDWELDHRLGRLTVEQVARDNQVVVSAVGRYVARQEVALLAHASGTVTDVRLDRLERFCAGIGATMRGKEIKAYLSRSLYDPVREGEPIAYVPQGVEHGGMLAARLDGALIITSAPRREPSLKPALDHLRDATVRALQEASEAAFERLLNVYVMVAEFHTRLVAATGAEAPPPWGLGDLFPEWRFVILIERDLDVVIDHAVGSQSRVFVDCIAANLYYIASGALHTRDPRMFRFAVERFQALHWCSQAAEAKRGVELTRLYLTGRLADFDIVPAFEEGPPDATRVSEVKRYLAILEGAIAQLAKTAIDFGHADSFAQTIRDGEELLEHYHPRPQLYSDLFAASTAVEDTRPESPEHQDAAERRAAIDYLLRLREIHAEEWTQTVFVIGAYILERYQQGSTGQGTCGALMKPVLDRLSDLSVLFRALSVALSQEYRWTIFDQMQESKRAQWINPQAKYYLLYCLLGIHLARIVPMPEQPFQSESFGPHDVDAIRRTSQGIMDDHAKWAWLTGPTSREEVEKFVSFHEEIAASREQRRDQRIILSDLSQDTIALFSSRAHAAARDSSAMRYWLERYQALLQVDELAPAESELISRATWEDKATFTERERSDAAAQLGAFLGDAVAAALDARLLQALLRAREGYKPKRPLALGHAMATARHWLERRSSSTGVIVVPVGRTATILHTLPDFSYPEAVQGTHPARLLHGFYGTIPILAVRDDIMRDNILAIDVGEACRALVTPPRSEVRTPTDREIESLMDAQPNLTERVLRVRVWTRCWQRLKLEDIDSEGLFVVQLPGEQ
jgi:hypothetical protein